MKEKLSKKTKLNFDKFFLEEGPLKKNIELILTIV